MMQLRSLAGGFALGAAYMYFFDPQRGKRRRSIARDRMGHSVRTASHGLEVGWRDLWNRTRGGIAEARLRFNGDDVPDSVLHARVRSRIGRVVSHPRALRVAVTEGVVRLRGPVLADELNSLLRTASSVPGVREVRNELEVHETADVPSLQGGRARQGYPGPLARERWKPATRLVAGGVGLAATAVGFGMRGAGGVIGGLAGLGLLMRAGSNERLAHLLGVDREPDLIDVQKTVHLDAPVPAVFSFWDRVENFPHFMRNVRDVSDLGEGRSRWTVAGPAGVDVQWEAVVVERVPNEYIIWRTTESSLVQHAGIVRFTEEGPETTRVDVHLTYTPPAGALGHVVATLFGADPKHELDGDMARMKTMIETGHLPHDAARRDGSSFMASSLPADSANGH